MRLKTHLILLGMACATLAFADDPKTKPAASYPLATCTVSGEKLPTDGSVVIEQIDGREVRFCCGDCVPAFKKDLAKSHKKLDDQIITATKDSYPLKTCIVSDEKLGDMGEPVMYVHRPTNQLVEFCCKACIKPFEKDPKAHLAKLTTGEK